MARACRICFESEGELISPCPCRGSAAYVHFSCLRKSRGGGLAVNIHFHLL